MRGNAGVMARLIDEVWNGGNLALIDEIVDSSVVNYDPLGGEMHGIESYKSYVEALRSAFPDLHIDALEIDPIADKVYVRWSATGTHTGSLLGIAPTNSRGTVDGVSLNRFEHGRIVESRYEWDSLGLFQQLGLLPGMEAFARVPPVLDAEH